MYLYTGILCKISLKRKCKVHEIIRKRMKTSYSAHAVTFAFAQLTFYTFQTFNFLLMYRSSPVHSRMFCFECILSISVQVILILIFQSQHPFSSAKQFLFVHCARASTVACELEIYTNFPFIFCFK